ncbi:MAG TPA: DUF6297 family protein, partial [Actinopolymorphaceae bacterium]
GIGPGSAIGLGSAVGLGAVAGAGIGALLAAVAVLLQQRPGGRRVVIGSCDVLLVGLLALTPWASAVVVPLPTPIGLAGTAVIALGAAVVVAIGAVGGLSRLPRRDLLAGSELLAGLSGAAASMDTSLVSDLLVHRRFRRLGRARSRRGRWTGPMAIPVREAWRVLRSPGRLVLAVGLLAVPYAVATLGVASAVPAAAVAAGYVALRPWGGGLHAVSRSPGFRRAFPLGDRGLRLLLATPLLAVAVVWSLLVAPATALGWAGGLAVAATVAAGVVRSSTRPPVTYDGPLMSTPAGAIPMGFVTQVFRGPDVALVGVLPMVLGLPTPLTVVLPIVVLGYVLGTGRL